MQRAGGKRIPSEHTACANGPLEEQAQEAEVIAGLNSAKGLFKKEISRAVKVRHIPELIFKMDHSMEYGRHIEEILGTIDFDSYQKDEEEPEDEF